MTLARACRLRELADGSRSIPGPAAPGRCSPSMSILGQEPSSISSLPPTFRLADHRLQHLGHFDALLSREPDRCVCSGRILLRAKVTRKNSKTQYPMAHV